MFLFWINLRIFNIQQELTHKIFYIILVWCFVGLCFYTNVEYFILYISKVLHEYLIIKDFHDIIVIYVKLTFWLTTLLTFLFLMSVFWLWEQSILYKTQKQLYIVFLLVYSILIVIWIVKQDLFYSNWEIFLLSTKNLLFDIQPDFYLFFTALVEDLIDFFVITLGLYIFYYWFFSSKIKLQLTYKGFRILFLIFLNSYCIYFFSCETFINWVYYSIFSVFIVELSILTLYFLIQTKKIIIMSKYLF